MHRFLADNDFAGKDPFVPQIAEKRAEKVAIIGSGPAGLTTAYYLAMKGYQVTVFEKLPVAGGMMAVGIPAYRLPRNELAAEIAIIEKMGVEIKTGVAFGTDITLESLKADRYKAVFLATGLHGSRRLGVPGEDMEGVLPGVAFLRDAALNKKISLGKRVVVVGGGNVAIDVALTAKRLGAENVSMVCLEARYEMPAWDYEIEEALEEGINIINCFGPKSFIGKDGKVTGIEFKQCTCVFDDNRCFNPQYDENVVQTLDADTVIVAIGQSAELDFAKGQNIPVTKRGGLESDLLTFQTPVPWVFAGGDVVYGPKSVVDAVASGKAAAESIDRFINGLDVNEGREKTWEPVKPDTSNEVKKERVPVRKISPGERDRNFKEVALGFDEKETRLEAERCLKCGICSECYQCVDACLAKAIDHNQEPVEKNITVGSVILSSGTEIYDPSVLADLYRYKVSPNVMTSLEFERILSASGPTMGHLERPSDKTDPKKIAWLQCVGSRDTNKCGNGYCSSVCCMYAIKDAMIAKEHSHGNLDCTIFNMDIRTFGKDYEKYYLRAKDREGIRFVKARVHTITEVPGTGDLSIRFVDEVGAIMEETFSMVVLSVGLQVKESSAELAKRLGIKMNKYNFAETDPFAPVATSRPGVYTCGIFQGPKDIPSSVTEAGAAACEAGVGLAEARGTDTKARTVPDEIDVQGETPRIGVFVCNCGINIGGVVDVPEVKEYSSKLPYVVYSDENLFTCSQDTQDKIKEKIIEHKLNRLVVASCSPKTHEKMFMETLEACGLNKYLFEMANIRNQDSWIHSKSPDLATQKAKDLVRMAVARAGKLNPLTERVIPVNKRALVIGGGIAGMNAALGLGNQGFEVVLVEKEKQLGGMARRLHHTIEGNDIKAYIKKLVGEVESCGKIRVLTDTRIVGFGGYKGNFNTDVVTGSSKEKENIGHGVIIVATGANEYKPQEFLYGQDSRVMTQVEFGDFLEDKGASGLSSVVMIQCVGSRNEKNQNCSRICCQNAVKNALAIKRGNPDAMVYILYRDIRTYGLLEDYYTEARKLGVIFIRFDENTPPEVKSSPDGLAVEVKDHILNKKLAIEADKVILSAGVEAQDTEELSGIMKLGRNPEGFFIEAHVKLRPVDMPGEGIFLCGMAHGPKLISETIAQAKAAASRATTFLSKSEIKLSAITAKVDTDHCVKCLTCVRSCPFGVPVFNEKEGVIEIDEALCHGCGICAGVCPRQTIQLRYYEDDQIMCKIDALLAGGM
jgi:heterodisulfide reductase subunit A-like polyferredoxin